jgi:hypothetical protein
MSSMVVLAVTAVLYLFLDISPVQGTILCTTHSAGPSSDGCLFISTPELCLPEVKEGCIRQWEDGYIDDCPLYSCQVSLSRYLFIPI